MTAKKIILLAGLTVMLTQMAQAQREWKGRYPETRKGEVKDVYFNQSVPDPYRWLEDDRSEDTKDWVIRQNKATQSYLDRIPFRDAIKNRLAELWNYEKYSSPFKEGSYTYFFKNDGLQNQSVLYREKDGGVPEVFLDPNQFSKDGTTSLSGISFSKDGSLCAYSISEGGSDWNKIIIIETATKKQIGDTLMDVKFSGLSWRKNEGIYYSSYDKPLNASALSAKTDKHKLYFHKLGDPQSKDQLIFGGDATPRRYVGGEVTEDQRVLVITAANATYGNELYVQDLTKKDAPIIPVVTGFEHEQNVVYSRFGKLLIITNQGAPNKKLVLTDMTDPTPGNWRDIIPEERFPLSISTAGGTLFAHYVKDAVTEVKQYTVEGEVIQTVILPGLGTASGFSAKEEDKETYYTFTSYVYPPTIYRYDIATGESELYRQSNFKIDVQGYESKLVFYPSSDGTVIPMIITGKKGFQLNGKNPMMLYGYGGFSISLTPSFSVSNMVFMENGGLYAVANLRGGGEYGDEWHNQGTKERKQNVFNDFIAAAEYLIAEKYTSKELLAISGGSNGGLLVGACMTQRPDLFQVCFPAVGVLDMLRYHKFTAGAGWAYDYGTADDNEQMFKYLLGYSPLHNLKKGKCYPATMVTTGDHDDRVVPAHSFKFAAALQDAQSCKNPTLIRIETNAGHGAGKPTSKIIDEQADKWAFMFWNMGVKYNQP